MKLNIIASLILISSPMHVHASPTQFSPQINNEKPNIVFILAEDMNPRLGIYDDPNAITPNIDEFAKESVTFMNAFTMAGVSSPSRAGLITGMPQNGTGLQHMRTGTYTQPYRGVPPSYVKAYPELMRQNGYFTYVDVKTDYQFSDNFTDVGPFTIWDAHGTYFNFDDQKVRPAWRMHDLKNKPFYINLNPQITHESGLYTLENAPEDFKNMPVMWNKLRSFYNTVDIDPNKLQLDPYWKDTSKVREEVALFYKNINVLDQQVGNIIKQLKEDGLWDNTIVIFSADNGDGLPRHKREGYDSGTHVPLIVRIPEKYRPAHWPKNGSKDDRLVSFEDLAPTLLGFTKTNIPDYMKGINLSLDNPPEREYIYSSRGRIDDIYLRSYYVRDKNFQYVQNIDLRPNGDNVEFRNSFETMSALHQGLKNNTLSSEQKAWFLVKNKEELYDLKNDPWQLNNIANNVENKEKLALYRSKLENWRNTINDTGIIDESQLVADIHDENGKTYKTLPPVAEQNNVTKKIYIANRTDGASIGYSVDGKNWDVYSGAFELNKGINKIYIKAVRYGWDESEVVTFDIKPPTNK
ncbi:sulfatase [Proteus sp. TJ1640]|uniref:sulfatase family protein n=1 Tax=Proteus sp. TJ1640 TaxID=2050968 RepID=UPI000D68A5AD|nr:sulfatase [Proteus sp. TJ1640]